MVKQIAAIPFVNMITYIGFNMTILRTLMEKRRIVNNYQNRQI